MDWTYIDLFEFNISGGVLELARVWATHGRKIRSRQILYLGPGLFFIIKYQYLWNKRSHVVRGFDHIPQGDHIPGIHKFY